MTATNYTYVARADCGCVLGCCADRADMDTVRNVSDFVQDRLHIERMPDDQFKAQVCNEPTFMKCPHGQMDMWGEETESL